MCFFGAAQNGGVRSKRPLPKICHTYPTVRKPGTVIFYPKKTLEIHESHDAPLEF